MSKRVRGFGKYTVSLEREKKIKNLSRKHFFFKYYRKIKYASFIKEKKKKI